MNMEVYADYASKIQLHLSDLKFIQNTIAFLFFNLTDSFIAASEPSPKSPRRNVRKYTEYMLMKISENKSS